jgi:hypothetical protein
VRSRRDLELALDGIAQDAQTRRDPDLGALGERLDQATAELARRGWQDDGELAAAAGRALAELGRLGEALACYDRAVAANRAAMPIRTLEQRINLRARLAVARARGEAEPPLERAQAVQEIRAALADLDQLTALTSDTTERRSLRASAYKRLALVSSGAAREAALRRMAELYAEAAGGTRETLRDRAGGDLYPQLNWLMAELLLHVRGEPEQPPPAWLRHGLRAAYETAHALDAAEPSFWNAVMRADALLFAELATASAGDARDDRARLAARSAIAAAYVRARARGSRLKLASTLEQLEFFRELLPRPRRRTGEPEAPATALAASLGDVLRDLRREV